MFVRVKTTPNSPRKSIQIVEGKRFGKGVKQTIIAHVGVVTKEEDKIKLVALAKTMIADIIKKRASDNGIELNPDEIKSLMNQGRKNNQLKAKQSINAPQQPTKFDDLVEEFRFNCGVSDIVGSVFDNLGFNTLLKSTKHSSLLKNLVLTRMVYPQSKLKLCETMDEKFGVKYNEDQIYRMMDKLYPKIKQIKQLVFNKTHALMPEVNILLFDVTTLYCESVIKDGLREFGFSKDGKFNNTQIVLALATNDAGLPIGYELLPGNCAEVHTLLAAINSWSKIFDIKKACFIGDRAMFSEENIKLIEEHGYNYIIAAKLRAMPDEMQNKILESNNYKPIEFGDEIGRVAEFTYPHKTDFIKCSFSEEYGYIVSRTGGDITGIKYIAPNNTELTMHADAFKELKSELNKLVIYSSKCPCLLLTEEEYKLKQPNLFNNKAIIVGNEIIYKQHKANINLLTQKELEQLVKSVNKNKIANSLMNKLFGDIYLPQNYINIPCEFMVKLFPHYKLPTRRLCVSYKSSRANNDAIKRNRILERLGNKEGNINRIIKSTAKKYMMSNGNTRLDNSKISMAEQWDGLHGVLTNIIDDRPEIILSRYSNLWRIEEAFRINKHNLQMRPIYHYKPERIHTHIAICYMVFTLIKLVQYHIQLTKPQLKLNDILSLLLKVEYSIYVDSKTDVRYKMQGYMSREANMLYQAFGIKRNNRISVLEE